jgi:hypothetical protein
LENIFTMIDEGGTGTQALFSDDSALTRGGNLGLAIPEGNWRGSELHAGGGQFFVFRQRGTEQEVADFTFHTHLCGQ